MNKINEFFKKNFYIIFTILAVLLLLKSCNNDTKVLSKKVESLSQKIDSLQRMTVTKKELKIEGLKSEKRMIQSTDRKILDVNRQSEIDKEIEALLK